MADGLQLPLQKKQRAAFNSTAGEILYGGAAGGGKSHLMRVCAIVWCCLVPGLQVYLFRRISDDLKRNHVLGPNGFLAMLAGMVNARLCVITEDEVRFANGSRIHLCHCKDEKDIYKYQGAEIHVLLIDELTHFLESMYRFLRNRVRMTGLTVPPQLKGLFPRILCGANPGNVGHPWVKRTFIDNRLPLEIRQEADEEGGMTRQYIPARVDDNPKLLESDPGYISRLKGLGSKALVSAMLNGDWDVIEGAFFDCWSNDKHLVRPFEVPKHWLRFRSMDWGSAKPFSVGWWAVVSDTVILENGHVLMRGDLVRYREWYGCVPGKPDTGLKMTAEAVGAGIAEREAGDTIAYGVLDPACFAENGGPSIAEGLYKGSGGKVIFRPADNTRVASRGAMSGWDQMRTRLKGECTEDGLVIRPALVCFSTCLDSIRTIPALQHDSARPEDLDTAMEDHAADEWRYACASRPWIPTVPQPVAPRWPESLTLDEAWNYGKQREESRV